MFSFKPLILALLLLAVIGQPVVSATQRTPAGQILRLVNQIRKQHHLPPLRVSKHLSKSAVSYAMQMGRENFVGHIGPDGSTCSVRNAAAGYYNWRCIAENIAAGYKSPRQVVDAWMRSPAYRENILNPSLKQTGIGYAHMPGSPYEHYWVQEFGTRR